MRNYDVWTLAHKLVLFVYREILVCFPPGEQYNLRLQTKRAAYSVPLNFVEDGGRNTGKDFAHFLDNPVGSLQQLRYASLFAHDLEYISREKYQHLGLITDEVKAN
ncbi:four helix bundle protein [Niabella aurantiaca]|uniref:four helix bundle protein n=1 Tax=Niabella aurantiaca TaxID=379900 RepID=UPI00036E18FE|nr:four helix bundle protein [Niabella aurantiaca]